MKRTLLLLYSVVAFTGLASAQVTYTIDTTGFNALTLDGGIVQSRLADINQDGHLDWLTVGDHGSPYVNTNQHGITVFFGNGTGTGWTLYQNGDFGYGGIAVGDINNDGLQDVAYGVHHNYSSTDFGDQLCEAALGDGTGMNWTPWDDSLGLNGEDYGMCGTDLADFDNDGWLDYAGNSFGCCSGVHIYKNLGTGTWRQWMGCCNGNTGKYIQAGDINHDGNLDFVVSNRFGSPYFGDGTGNFTLQHVPNLPAVTNNAYLIDVSLGDIDNDGDDDFAFTYQYGVYVFRWNELTMQWDDASAGLPAPSTDRYLISRLADLDRDGFLDLVTASRDSMTVLLYKGDGTSWTLMQTYFIPNMIAIQDANIDDIDHNGYPDILLWTNIQTGWFSTENRLTLLMEDHVPAELNIMPTYPRHYECFPNNAVRLLHWTSAVPNNDAASVKIELSSTGSGGPWNTIAAAVPNNGTYQWTVPSSLVSADCYLRYTLYDSVLTTSVFAVTPVEFAIGICDFSTDVPKPAVSSSVKVYPNPTTGSITLQTTYINPIESVTVYSYDGREVKTFYNLHSTIYNADLQGLSAGIYFLDCLTENGNQKVKVVKY